MLKRLIHPGARLGSRPGALPSLVCVGVWLASLGSALARDCYLAQNDPHASEANAGPMALPFRALKQACAATAAGDTVYLRAGTYREQLIPRHSGAEGRRIV